ncbi:TPA: hypothetical protein NJ546_004540 [Vibrio parahaemolyticus]|uniref:hypothetical protein n=1 Tax=Vibrio parahaemolyticus TaxID=670 RepID=UPI000B233443|nr:hypothetical protein [Vibrio parahaemolyticus]EGR0760792.1 hypothetical protein [Vibrio parahaemolyticus]HCG8434908.1 hypothetical protein [Vibrio parahaemolyticus]
MKEDNKAETESVENNKSHNLEKERYIRDIERQRAERFEKQRQEARQRIYLQFTFVTAFSIIIVAAITNSDAFKLDPETLVIINQAMNAVILLMIPFFLGSLGGLTRILVADTSVPNKSTLVVSSGLMAMFSWVGIKSGVLLAIVSPHLEKQGIPTGVESHTTSGFYTMALVAILVGMFSTNLYLFINGRVEQLVTKSQVKKP